MPKVSFRMASASRVGIRRTDQHGAEKSSSGHTERRLTTTPSGCCIREGTTSGTQAGSSTRLPFGPSTRSRQLHPVTAWRLGCKHSGACSSDLSKQRPRAAGAAVGLDRTDGPHGQQLSREHENQDLDPRITRRVAPRSAPSGTSAPARPALRAAAGISQPVGRHCRSGWSAFDVLLACGCGPCASCARVVAGSGSMPGRTLAAGCTNGVVLLNRVGSALSRGLGPAPTGPAAARPPRG